jgi:hypothetical protein
MGVGGFALWFAAVASGVGGHGSGRRDAGVCSCDQAARGRIDPAGDRDPVC